MWKIQSGSKWKNEKNIFGFLIPTSMKWISYQISMSYNELYLINFGISGRERERERERETCIEFIWEVVREKYYEEVVREKYYDNKSNF